MTLGIIQIQSLPQAIILAVYSMNLNASEAQYKSHPICETCLQWPIITL